MLNYFPKYYANKAIMAFCLIMGLIMLIFRNYILPIDLLLFVFISVIVFFYFVSTYSIRFRNSSESLVIKKYLNLAIILRLVFVVFIYFYNLSHFGIAVGSTEDVEFYMDMGHYGQDMIMQLDIIQMFKDWDRWGVDIADMGYPLYLAIVYLFTGGYSDVMIPFLLKAFWGTWTCLLIYKIGKRHFGDSVARMAMLFCALNPVMIWWCGSMMKETEMVFFTVAFINCWDDLISAGNKSKSNVFITLALSLYLFTFRVALGIVALLSVALTLILSLQKIKNKGKILVVIAFCCLFMAIGFYDTMSGIVNQIYSEVVVNDNKAQQVNMEWRSTRVGGNEFAKYAGAAVFAPLIFTIPFPTLVSIDFSNQFLNQVAGGNFVKNILSFFVIIAVFYLIFKKKWKEHLLPLSFMCGYLVMLVLSIYAQSGRFHMPIVPFEMLFAAYGLSLITKKNYHWFNYVLIFEVIVCVAWNWFKLAGRHLI